MSMMSGEDLKTRSLQVSSSKWLRQRELEKLPEVLTR